MKIFSSFRGLFHLQNLSEYLYQAHKRPGKRKNRAYYLHIVSVPFVHAVVAPIAFLHKTAFPTAPALIWAVIGGIAMFSCSMCCLMALKSGALFILTTLFSSISIIIPNTASIFMFDERLSLPQWIAMIALVYSAYLLLGCSREACKTFSLKSILFLTGIFIAEGLTMLSSKAYAAYAPPGRRSFLYFLRIRYRFPLNGHHERFTDPKNQFVALLRHE